MRVLIIQHEDLVPPGAVSTWCERNNAAVDIARPDQGDALPPPEGYNLIVILGGTMDVTDAPHLSWLAAELEWIRTLLEAGGGSSPVPLLGICLGGQLIAKARGAHVGPMPTPERGWHTITLTHAARTHPILRVLPAHFESFESHRQGFELPGDATLLGTSRGWEPQLFALGDRTIGLQFHPEFTEDIIREILAAQTSSWEGQFVEEPETFFAEPDRFARQHAVLYHLLDGLTA